MASFVPISNEIVIPPDGIVNLCDKKIPVCEVHNDHLHDHYAYTRGIVDITAFKKYLNSLPEDAWETEGQKDNVAVKRPAHDNWGIKKIVFVFCDDFLLKVFELPYARQPEWKKLLRPIYDAIGIDETKVVRSLLAAMPPGVNIPVHHDTGYWVKHTHRLHVAIETGEGVNFYVGPNEANMRKYSFDEGRIVELNNQAKHAVTNGMNRYRIHLIFDYVEDHPINRYQLDSKDKINQTRRTIDLVRDQGTRKSPTFIIIGAQKCGTTSLYEYLCQHTLILRGKRRETHYFDWRWDKSVKHDDWNAHHEKYMEYFDAQSLYKYPSLITGESTPSYLLHSDIVIPRILNICPWVKILVMLRNPVDRAYSHYQMCIDPTGTPEQLQVRGMSSYVNKTFEEVIEAEINELERLGINAESSHDDFKNKFLVSRPLTHGGHSLIARGLYAIQLEPWLQALGQNIMIMSIKELSKGKSKDNKDIQRNVENVLSFIGIPPHDIEDLEPKNSRNYEGMSDECRQRLIAFYEPYNLRLWKLLNGQIDW